MVICEILCWFLFCWQNSPDSSRHARHQKPKGVLWCLLATGPLSPVSCEVTPQWFRLVCLPHPTEARLDWNLGKSTPKLLVVVRKPFMNYFCFLFLLKEATATLEYHLQGFPAEHCQSITLPLLSFLRLPMVYILVPGDPQVRDAHSPGHPCEGKGDSSEQATFFHALWSGSYVPLLVLLVMERNQL